MVDDADTVQTVLALSNDMMCRVSLFVKLSLMKSKLGSNVRRMAMHDELIACYGRYAIFFNQDDLDFFVETLQSLQSLELNLYIKEAISPGKKPIDLKQLLKQNQELISERNSLELELSAKNQEISSLKEQLDNSVKEYQDEKKRRLELEISIVSLNLSKDQKVKELQIENDRLLRKMQGEQLTTLENTEKSTSLLSLIE
jgi:hypothetical protein